MGGDHSKVVAEVILRATQVVHGVISVVNTNPSPLYSHLSLGIPTMGNEDVTIARGGIITEEQHGISLLKLTMDHSVPVLLDEEILIEQFHALVGKLEAVDQCERHVLGMGRTGVVIHHIHCISTVAHQRSHCPALRRRIGSITIELVRTVGTILTIAVLKIPCISGDNSLAAVCLSVIHTVCTCEIHRTWILVIVEKLGESYGTTARSTLCIAYFGCVGIIWHCLLSPFSCHERLHDRESRSPLGGGHLAVVNHLLHASRSGGKPPVESRGMVCGKEIALGTGKHRSETVVTTYDNKRRVAIRIDIIGIVRLHQRHVNNLHCPVARGSTILCLQGLKCQLLHLCSGSLRCRNVHTG